MRTITIRQTIKIFTFSLVTVALGLVQAQAKSDFSGTWKLNVAKSDFGPMPAPETGVQKITHTDPTIKANIATTGGPQGDVTYDITYTTDGKESVNHLGDNEFKSTANWEGDELVVNTKGSFGGNDFTSKDRWTLSADGKTLTIARHFSSSMGEADIKELFEKQ